MSKPRELGVFLFVMPFASPSSVRHAEKLSDSLAAVSDKLVLTCDARVSIDALPAHTQVFYVPTLEYLRSSKVPFVSLIGFMLRAATIIYDALSILIRFRCEIQVVVCFLGSYYTPLLVLARLLGKGVVIYEPGNELSQVSAAHGVSWPARLLSTAINVSKGVNRRLAHLCVVESTRVIENAGMRKVRHKARIGTLFVDDEVFDEPTPPIECRPRLVGYVGRLSKDKNVSILVDAVASLGDLDIECEIIGDGPLRTEIEQRIATASGDFIQLLRWLCPREVAEHMKRFKLTVLPSVGEGVPNGLIEAMAAGASVLATAVGGVPDFVIDGETGYLLPSPSYDDIRVGIRRALSDPRLSEIAAAGQRLVREQFSKTASRQRWSSILIEARSRARC